MFQETRRGCRLFRMAAVFAFVMVLGASAIPHEAHGAASLFGSNLPPSFADLADKVKDSVVNISTTQVIKGHPLQPFMEPNSPFREFFGDEFFKRFFGDIPKGSRKTNSLGSGVVIDASGLILTNNHVVEKATEIKIKLQNGQEYAAKVVGRDPKTDLALIQAEPDKNFPKPAALGDSNALRVGDWVMAVGNPFGLGHTVTVGIISAKGRIIGAGPYDDFLQTDAAINPGNSGGPLFNMNGEVVGINTAIVARGQGIGFAIPINVAKDLLPQLRTGKIVRGWLGIMIQDVTPEIGESFGLKETKGVLVSDVVKDSPAEKGGIEVGDIITKFNGEEVHDAHELSRRVAATPPNSKVKVELLRDGSKKVLTITLGTMPDEEEAAAQPESRESVWGLKVQNMTKPLAERFGWDSSERGVIVTEVEPDSPAAEARIQPGDLIKEVNRKKIQNVRDYNQAMKGAEKKKSLLLLVKRGQRSFYVVLQRSES
ncbi:DegQ family serine endoprotease [Desulfosoma caldarium]|uniref:Probable periplasmic serine endoprotease DegP-like n=1 Tax=Desulfosoma caldarium TaxID=610254 RepID=A0A3N1V003_9BACT|nr:DegQ family serine endoprotease [Desulfosoma caldarium]ROQ93441.1 serine protease Do [Desulfosoma caldarium]